MKLELQNIGGFAGVHEFELRKGINRITAPNARGKSSLLRGIECLARDDEDMFRDSLNDDSDAGYIKLDAEHEYIRNLRRANDTVNANLSEDHTFSDENSKWRNAKKIAFFTPKSRVVREIEQNEFDVLKFVESISDAEVIGREKRRKEAQLEENKRELEEYIENLTNAQKLDAEISTMRGDIQKLQEEVQKLEAEIGKEPGAMDLAKVSKDIAAKKQEILDLDERLRSREGEVMRYQKQYEEASALYERIDEKVSEFEQMYESPENSLEEFRERLGEHERRKKDLKMGKDMLDELEKVVDKAYNVFSDFERAIPERARDDPYLKRAYKLLGNPGECPVCSGSTALDVLEHRRGELHECVVDLSKEIRGEDEEMRTVKDKQKELKEDILDIKEKRRKRDDAKREADERLKELGERKDLCDSIDNEILERRHELEVLEQQYEAAARTVRAESRNRLNDVRKKIGAYENEIRNNQKEIDRLTQEIPDYTIGESLEEYAKKKKKGLDRIRTEIEELKDRYEHEIYGAVDLFNANINKIYSDMGFTTFRDIKIVKEITRDRLSSLDAIVEHESGKKQPLSSLSKAEQLTLGLVFQISAKENYITDFPFFVIDDNMNTFDPDRSRSIMKYLSDKAEYVLISQPVPPSEQEDLVVRYGFD